MLQPRLHTHAASPVVDGNGVVVSVEPMYERLDGRLVEMAQIRCGLSWLLSKHHGLWVDEPVTQQCMVSRASVSLRFVCLLAVSVS